MPRNIETEPDSTLTIVDLHHITANFDEAYIREEKRKNQT